MIEVERLGQTIEDLEEAILAGGATANMVRDYKRQIEELHVSLWNGLTVLSCSIKGQFIDLDLNKLSGREEDS